MDTVGEFASRAIGPEAGGLEHTGNANPGRQTPGAEFANSINIRVTSRKVATLDFAVGAKGEEKNAELKGPERLVVPNRRRFRSARAKGEILGGRAEGHRSPRRPSFTTSRPLLCGW